MKNTKNLSEYILVDYIHEFYIKNTREKDEDSVLAIETFCENKKNLTTSEVEELKLALNLLYLPFTQGVMRLLLQHQDDGNDACINALFSRNMQVYGGSKGFIFELIRLSVFLISSAFVALYGLGVDFYEMAEESFVDHQRIIPNIATTTLSLAFLAGAIVASGAILASTPFGWGIAAVVGIAIGLALLVKATRVTANYAEALASNADSGLKFDQRFALSESEENHLRKQHDYTDDDISKVKNIIRSLAVKAKETCQYGFLGQNRNYKDIIKLLTLVKKGDIPEYLAKTFDIKPKGTEEDNLSLPAST